MVQKQKLPKFMADGKEDHVQASKMCEMIWIANGVIEQDDWIKKFLATLWGVVINQFSNIAKMKMATWEDLKEYQIKFWLLKDDNEIMAEIYNTKQEKDKTIQGYGQWLKGLLVKMES